MMSVKNGKTTKSNPNQGLVFIEDFSKIVILNIPVPFEAVFRITLYAIINNDISYNFIY